MQHTAAHGGKLVYCPEELESFGDASRTVVVPRGVPVVLRPSLRSETGSMADPVAMAEQNSLFKLRLVDAIRSRHWAVSLCEQGPSEVFEDVQKLRVAMQLADLGALPSSISSATVAAATLTNEALLDLVRSKAPLLQSMPTFSSTAADATIASTAERWSAWSVCPKGYVALGIVGMEYNAGVPPAVHFHKEECEVARCRASIKGGVGAPAVPEGKVLTGCVLGHPTDIAEGPVVSKAASSGGFSEESSDCPIAYTAATVLVVDQGDGSTAGALEWDCETTAATPDGETPRSSGCRVKADGVAVQFRARCLLGVNRLVVATEGGTLVHSTSGGTLEGTSTCPTGSEALALGQYVTHTSHVIRYTIIYVFCTAGKGAK